MLILNPDDPLPIALRGAVVAIGNFDGVHLGHQDLIHQAKASGQPVLTLTFAPHPRRFFRPDCAPFLITPASVQNERLTRLGIDAVVRIRFDRDLSLLPPQAFIQKVLKDHLGAHTIAVGTDFHFGHDRAGSIKTLEAAGFQTLASSLLKDAHGQVISSTRIRGCLEQGHLDEAAALLGWPWFIRGAVVHGDARGRTLGYPTANIWLEETIAPAYGIYAAWVRKENGARHRAAVAVGRRPMFEVSQTLCEAHLLDFTGDLYGQTLDVQLVHKLRDEVKFDNLEALMAQMKKDCDSSRELLELGS